MTVPRPFSRWETKNRVYVATEAARGMRARTPRLETVSRSQTAARDGRVYVKLFLHYDHETELGDGLGARPATLRAGLAPDSERVLQPRGEELFGENAQKMG